MKKYAFLLLVLTALTVSLARLGFGGLPFEGRWSASGDLGEGMAWTQHYSFAAGTYSMDGYPPISESGAYEVVLHEQDGEDQYVLRMTPVSGDPSTPSPYLLDLHVYESGNMSMSSMSGGSSTIFTAE